jgi:hypothetical protein
LHDDSDSFSEFSQDSDIEIFDCTEPDAKICGPDFSDSCCNSDDSQASANVGSDNGGNDDGGGGYDNEDNNNDDWALWDENDHYFYMIPFCASFDYKLPQKGQMPVSPHEVFYTFLVQRHLKK